MLNRRPQRSRRRQPRKSRHRHHNPALLSSIQHFFRVFSTCESTSPSCFDTDSRHSADYGYMPMSVKTLLTRPYAEICLIDEEGQSLPLLCSVNRPTTDCWLQAVAGEPFTCVAFLTVVGPCRKNCNVLQVHYVTFRTPASR